MIIHLLLNGQVFQFLLCLHFSCNISIVVKDTVTGIVE
jgi:hypothetical protein